MAPKRSKEQTPQQFDQQVLAAIRRSGHAGVTSQQLSLQLGLKDKGQRHLVYDALERLQEEEKVRSGKKGRFHAAGGRDAIQGTIDMIASGAGYVRPGEAGIDDVYVHARDVGLALHGDTVRINVREGHGTRAEGRVLEVLQRRRTTFVGAIHKQQGRLVLVPTTRRCSAPS